VSRARERARRPASGARSTSSRLRVIEFAWCAQDLTRSRTIQRLSARASDELPALLVAYADGLHDGTVRA
jgi:hypothetical protein